MFDLYTWATPNGWKASTTLEELGLPYTVYPIDLTKNEQKSSSFRNINPNGRIPAIVDRKEEFTVFESGAIMIYLAELTGRLLPSERKARSKVMQWLMFQTGGIGPMQGQANVFFRYFPERFPTIIDRYQNETSRFYSVVDGVLADSEFLADDYSIADISVWAWVRIHKWAGVELDAYPHLARWLRTIEARPAAHRGAAVPFETSYHQPDDDDDNLAAAARTMVTR